MESLFTHHLFVSNGALRSCKDAMGESSSLQDRSVLGVSEDTIAAKVCVFTGTKELQGSPYAEEDSCHLSMKQYHARANGGRARHRRRRVTRVAPRI